MNALSNVRKIFDNVARDYEKHAIMQHEIAERMLQRLQYLKMKPEVVLDLGCGPGFSTRVLKKQYPDALVVGLDCSTQMLHMAQKKQRLWQKSRFVQADAMVLPFQSESVDLIFSNQVLHWLPEMTAFFDECFRVLKPQGCLMFSTLGPDTFKELRLAGSQVECFLDLHDIGDALVKHDFLDPVMDREDLCLHYASLEKLQSALQAQGVHCQDIKDYPTLECKWPVSYEVIYGQAWRARFAKQTGQQVISIEKLRASIPTRFPQ